MSPDNETNNKDNETDPDINEATQIDQNINEEPKTEENKIEEEIDEVEEAETNRRVTFEIIEVYPEELKRHEVNTILYGEEILDTKLVESIRRKGLLEPLIITKDYRIISGHRRWQALLYINKKKLGRLIIDDKTNNKKGEEMPFVKRKAKCQVVRFKNEEEEKLAIIEYNKKRNKRMSQTYNEIEMLHSILDDAAERAQKENLKQYTAVPTLVRRLHEAVDRGEIDTQVIDWSLRPEEIAYEYGHLVGGPKYENKEEKDKKKDKTNKKIGEIIGMGKTNVAKLTEIGRFASEFGDEEAIKAMERLDSGIWTINGAHIVVQMRKKALERKDPGATYCKSLLKEIESGARMKENNEKGKILTPAAAKKELDEQMPKITDEEIVLWDGFPIHHTYSVLYFDFPEIPEPEPEAEEDEVIELYELPDDIKKLYVPAASNAALFLTANSKNIKYCVNFMRIWGFKLKSYIIIETEIGHEMLLFGSRGKWRMPKPENWYNDIIRDKLEIIKIIPSIYPDVESFYRLNLDYNTSQPEGWGKSVETIKAEEYKKQRKVNHGVDEGKDDRKMHPGMQGAW
jgi:hypothetical protein